MSRRIDCKVKVIAHLEARPNVIRWEMDAKNKHGDKLVFSNECIGDEYLVEFALDDKTGFDLIFPDDVSDALWVSDSVPEGNPKCPQSPNYNSAFKAQSVGPKGNPKKLTVLNTNCKVENFAFSLRVIPRGKDQSKPANFLPPYDPIVVNKNGGVQGRETNAFALALGAVAVAAVAYVAFEAFFD